MELWSLLEDARSDHGPRPARVEGGRSHTWTEVARACEALAAGLAARGVGHGDRVAILEDNTSAFLEAYLAAAGLGAILVPVNVHLAPPELAVVLEDAAPALVLVGARYAARLAQALARVPTGLLPRLAVDLPAVEAVDAGASPAPLPVPREPLAALRAAGPGRFSPRPVSGRDPAQLYYTSGTTGRPKGVVLTHENVGEHALAACSELDLYEDDVWGHFAPMFHLADAWATFAITHVGGCHVMHPRFEAASVRRCLRETGVTVTNLVPTMLQRLLAEVEEHPVDDPAAEGGRLRLMLSGGSPAAPAVVRRTLALLGCEYAQTYGMTETSPYLTLSLLTPEHRRLPEAEQVRRRARTGRPFETVELRVVRPDGTPVAPDDREVGEIQVRGCTVTPGYWQRPEETAAAFVDGWLRTGDLATLDAEGWVDIVDRAKDMVLTGGENVYSIEVEAALLEHPDVLECAAYGVPHPEWGEELRVAVVPRAGRAVDPEALRAHCRARLARYKVPRRVELVDALPRTGSGKVRKATLRERAAGE